MGGRGGRGEAKGQGCGANSSFTHQNASALLDVSLPVGQEEGSSQLVPSRSCVLIMERGTKA